MKNNIIIFFVSVFFYFPAIAENLNIQSSSISINKNTKLTILKDNVIAIDEKNNTLKTDYAEYQKDLKILKSKGKTTIFTSEGYYLVGKNIIFDNKNKFIKSGESATITDLENNKIFLENFEYSAKENFFKSLGNIKVVDSKENTYNFSQVYIDEKKREIIGSDVKAYFNDKNFKVNKDNKPRIFANTVKIDDDQKEYTKSIFTLCNYRKDDKCPPWSLQSKRMRHDTRAKTIYYDHAVIKFYDFPIFYTPFLSHPDPSVDRRSGFLPPSFVNTKNLGAGLQIPYFMALNKDRDITFTSKLFESDHPLFLGEYRQAFNESDLILDFGYTEGYKKSSSIKTKGSKSHFFSKFVKNFRGQNNSDNSLEVTLQDVSHDKYLKLYKIKTNLAEYETDTIENSLNFTHENEELFLGLKMSSYETLKSGYNDKHEYILPDIILDKNLLNSAKYGSVDFLSNFKVHSYDTNKETKFLVNDIDWKSKSINFSSGLKGGFLGKLKNVNYEAKNTSIYKTEPTKELFGALGYLTEVNLSKTSKNNSKHFLTPKMLLRYAPNHMRKEEGSAKLNTLNLFNLDRLNTYNNFESGISTTLGFDYDLKKENQEFNLSLGQVLMDKENKNMPASSSLDEKLSDVVGVSNLKINNKFKLNYNFALDQNYKDLNYNEIGTDIDFEKVKFNISYLKEKKHIGNQEYFTSGFDYEKGKNGLFSFKTKRNLVTDSSEFYNLSYEYLNDCLRAGLVYRREFYDDSELEAENSLMFKVTFVPFGNVNSPSFSK